MIQWAYWQEGAMLLEEYDDSREAVINPEMFKERKEDFPKVCVAFFSHKLIGKIEERFKPEIIGDCCNATNDFPIYKIKVDGVYIAVYLACVGAAASVGQMEEVIAYGAEKFLFVGSCGCLDAEIEDYSIIIPTEALRDEGTSYHYLPASDKVELDDSIISAVEKTMKELGINYRKGTAWTTDGVFRETANKVKRRKEQGAITVDMECSALASVAKFRGVKMGQFFYAADNLGGEEYEPRSLISSDLGEKEKVIGIAFECVKEIAKIK